MTSRPIVAAVLLLLCVDFHLPIAVEAHQTVRVRVHVATADQAHGPIVGASVELKGTGATLRARTDSNGNSTLSDVPVGRYKLRATGAGYLPADYGALALFGEGTEINLTDKQPETFELSMSRAGSISGTVRDLSAEVAPDALVTITDEAGRSFQQWTDYRGTYRFYGITPGTYVVSARPQASLQGFLYPTDSTTDAMVDRALGRLRQGNLAHVADPTEALSAVRGLPTVYYPGTVDPSDAGKIIVDIGTDLYGIDLSLVASGTSSLAGRLEGPSTGVGAGTQLVAIDTASGTSYPGSVSDQGAFSFRNLPPGTYRVRVRIVGKEPPTKGSAPNVSWSEQIVQVPAAVGAPLVLQLNPAIELRGRVQSDGTAPLVLSAPQVFLERIVSNARSGQRISAVVFPDASFVVGGLDPGVYRFKVEGKGNDGSSWSLQGATAGARDLMAPFALTTDSAALSNLLLTVSTKVASLTGTLLDSRSTPMSGYYVLAFPTAPALRVSGSPRLALTRPDSDGTYRFIDLPPGEYFVTALSGSPGLWESAEFLQAAVASSVKVTLVNGRVTTQSLQLSR